MPATAKIFTHGGSQAVRLPKEFRLPGTEVRVRREGRAVILEPMTYDLGSIRSVFAQIDERLERRGFLSERPEDPPVAPTPPISFE